MKFELTNKERKYVGLSLVEPQWEKVQLTNEIYLYFDGSLIVKSITVTEKSYKESDMDEKTSEDRTLLLPKTKKGKPKKLNFTSFQARNGIGTYFSFTAGNYGVDIANYTTQKTFYSTSFECIEINDFTALRNWLTHFIATAPQEHLTAIKKFGKEERQRVKIKEGDFFAFKVDRENYGFGSVLLDIRKLRKEKFFENETHLGLSYLMQQPLTVKIYHKISPHKNIDLTALKKLLCFPSQYIMDNRLFYGDYEVIGNLPLEDSELEFPISFSRSIHIDTPEIVYLQWGLIYKETTTQKLPEDLQDIMYRKESIGLVIQLNKDILVNCIANNSNDYYWQSNAHYSYKHDLRNPIHKKHRDKILKHFGLNPSIPYHKNLLAIN
ncbi:immunity 26/phosphotriesterase HocA family protein [Flavobacteriaceae bacterium MHTCC 0001]